MGLQSPSSSFKYDVFLNFRGTDTRFDFTGNLYKTLRDKGIRTFIDDEELQRGDEITPSLIEAIKESRIAITIFSIDYASSSFCLDELVNIINCAKGMNLLVFPVFYDVDPSHVRHQRGTYAEALARHEERFKDNKEKFNDNMDRLQNWRRALNQVANLSGMHFKLGNEYEHEFIGKIVEEVSNRINRNPLHVANYLVGLESRVKKVMSLMDLGSGDGVHMVGIYGIGGMGKTTLARAIYNFMADQFEGLCFLHNVRENAIRYGLEYLQENVLSKTLGFNIKLGDVSEGISVIKQRLHQKKILLVLDDVDKLEQLRAIIGGPNWFGPGSKVIITTRDKHLLVSHGVERKFEVYGLKRKHALELFTWNAFRNDKIDPCYKDVLNQAIAYASGLPLALEIIGSSLFGKSIEEWKSALIHYERIPNKKVQNILEVSFYALEEKERSVFLDIACCFKGYRLTSVEHILHAHHGDCVKYHIGVLTEKSLIKITQLGDVFLHDLIEDMGRDIVRQESPKEPGKRSRLWSHEDIMEVLEKNTGTPKIEMLCLVDSSVFEEEEWDAKAFKKMKNLKTLIVQGTHFSKGPKHLPNNLRVLEWWNYPSKHLPYHFHPKNLSICNLPDSCITLLEFPTTSKRFGNMKVLNLHRCQFLTQIANVSSLSNLEELSFKYCENLVTVDNSVGLLDKLEVLYAKGCNKLKCLPPLKLPSLEQLDLSGCSSLQCFPEILEKMEHITELRLERTYITKFPSSFQNLTRLRTLQVTRWLPTRIIVMMPHLDELIVYDPRRQLLEMQDEGAEKAGSTSLSSNVKNLTLSKWDLSDDFLALIIPCFANLKELDLSESKFTIVPECIKNCLFLWNLVLDDCKQLREMEGIPPNLKCFSAIDCESLSSSCRSMLLKQELHEAGNTFFRLPSLETGRVPEWFEHQGKGSPPSVSFSFRNNFPNILLCLVGPPGTIYHPIFVIINGNKFVYTKFNFEAEIFLSAFPGHTLVLHMLKENLEVDEGEFCPDEELLENEWNHAEVTVAGGYDNEYILGNESNKYIGIHVLKGESCVEDIRFTNPNRKRKLPMKFPSRECR